MEGLQGRGLRVEVRSETAIRCGEAILARMGAGCQPASGRAKRLSEVERDGGVEGGDAVVGHHAEAVGQVLELAGWRRLGDVEQAVEGEAGEQRSSQLRRAARARKTSGIDDDFVPDDGLVVLLAAQRAAGGGAEGDADGDEARRSRRVASGRPGR